jgi:protein-L-isoaspartate(D-aspartate) O-methyltransferase
MNSAQQAEARLQMTNQQVRTWDVLDADVLAVQASIPRENFVAAHLQAIAYADAPLPIGHQQHLWSPKLAGKVLQTLAVKPGESILEIGTGSGYLSACLAGLGAKVTSVEIHPDLAAQAKRHWASCHITGIDLINADALSLDFDHAFDVVVFTASLEECPAIAWNWVKPNGRIVLPLGRELQRLTRLTGSADHPLVETLFETAVDPLIQAPRKHFEF